MKDSLLCKNLRLVALANMPPLIAVVVGALIAPGYVASKIREAIGFLVRMLH